MRRLGILGGVSPASTEIYYRALNEGARSALGGHASAPLLIHSFNFADVVALQQNENWQAADDLLAEAALGLERAGVDAVLLACNTMHRCAPAMEAALTVPFLHIADAAAARLSTDRRSRPALLGTLTTMEHGFIKDRLGAGHGLDIRTPEPNERADIDRVIFDELCRAEIRPESEARYVEICERLQQDGADSVILGCTEIGLLLNAQNCPLPAYDTAQIHVEAALEFMLGSETCAVAAAE